MNYLNDVIYFFEDFLTHLGSVWHWLNTPMVGLDNDLGLGWAILEKIGLDISWIYNVTPIHLITAGLATFVGAIIIFKIVKMILDAIPVL